jgi:hypothetical protein
VEHFHAQLMESDHAIEYSRHGIAEHHEIYSLIEKLEETDKSSSAFHENTARVCSSPFVRRIINCMNKTNNFETHRYCIR